MKQKEFRAWNPIEQEWEYYTLNDLCYNTNRPDICLEKWTQWTGLVDCKGNKIFEGDILCFKSKFSENKQYFEIEWNNEITNCGCCYDVWGVGFDFSDLVDSNYEVIGNRFQNPELIKK